MKKKLAVVLDVVVRSRAGIAMVEHSLKRFSIVLG
jgi:hypothetical protein